MTPEQALIEAIARAPWEVGPRQVYADWLEQRGDERARFLRAQLDFAARLEAGTQGELWPQLALQHLTLPSDWLSRVALRLDAVLEGYDRSLKIGVIKQIRLLTGLGLKRSKELADTPPVVLLRGLDCATAEAVRLAMGYLDHLPGRRLADVRLVPSTSPPCAPDDGRRRWVVGLLQPSAHLHPRPVLRHPPEALRPHLEALPEAARGELTLLDAVVLQQLLLHHCERTLPLVVTWLQEPGDDEA